jgi:hypothetical protein
MLEFLPYMLDPRRILGHDGLCADVLRHVWVPESTIVDEPMSQLQMNQKNLLRCQCWVTYHHSIWILSNSLWFTTKSECVSTFRLIRSETNTFCPVHQLCCHYLSL